MIMILRTIEQSSWHLGKAYTVFCTHGKAVFFDNWLDIQSREPIYQPLFFALGITFCLAASHVMTALEAGLIISTKALTCYLRCLERKTKSMLVYEVSTESYTISTLYAL